MFFPSICKYLYSWILYLTVLTVPGHKASFALSNKQASWITRPSPLSELNVAESTWQRAGKAHTVTGGDSGVVLYLKF